MDNVRYLTAIIYCNQPQPITGNQFLKYRNIKDTEQSRGRFMRFAAKFPGAEYINWYEKAPWQQSHGRFIERIYLQ